MNHAIAIESAPSLAPPKRRKTDNPNSQLWRALYYFNLYRLVLGGAFLTLAWSGTQIAEYGNRSTTLFQVAATAFALFSVANLFTITRGKPGFNLQASAQTVCDIVLITLMMYASDGVSSGLGLLLMVSIAGAGVVLPAKATMFLAALASLSILTETSVTMLLGQMSHNTYLQIGVLGAGIFMTGFIVSMLAGRMRESEQAILQARRDLQQQQLINDRIVQNLKSGVIVVDEFDDVLLSNAESERLLSFKSDATRESLSKLNEQLGMLIKRWRSSPTPGMLPALKLAAAQVHVRVSTLQQQDSGTLVVYLEDQTKVSEQAQQHKLAALGRLSAAIAHEIRNPLSAVSHASQLLAENPEVSTSDQRLLSIIEQQTDRINNVIESVLQLGRKELPEQHGFAMADWVHERIDAARARHQLNETDITVTGNNADVTANRGQMTQILDNLLDNAITHGSQLGRVSVHLTLGKNALGRATIQVRDRGQGITKENATHLFEPFFTTDSLGTGLGLYISRELGAANGVRLDYISDESPGCCFQLTFNDDPAMGVRGTS